MLHATARGEGQEQVTLEAHSTAAPGLGAALLTLPPECAGPGDCAQKVIHVI